MTQALTLGIDIGGTKIAAGLCDEQGRIVERTRVPMPRDVDAILEALDQICHWAWKTAEHVGGVGISAAGNVSSDRRTIRFSANVPSWNDYPLADKVERLIEGKAPVVVENDGNAAGWGEFRFGAGRGCRDMVMVTVGTGIGGAAVIDGRLTRGAFGMAGEIGHLPLVPYGEVCGCGLSGCAECYASGTALERFARQAARRDPEVAHVLMELCDDDLSRVDGLAVARAAGQGDPAALEAFRMTGEWLGRLMSALSAVLDPQVYVIGGGVAANGDLLLGPARAAFVRYLQASAFRPHAEIRQALAGGDAGIIGAADLARQSIDSEGPQR